MAMIRRLQAKETAIAGSEDHRVSLINDLVDQKAPGPSRGLFLGVWLDKVKMEKALKI